MPKHVGLSCQMWLGLNSDDFPFFQKPKTDLRSPRRVSRNFGQDLPLFCCCQQQTLRPFPETCPKQCLTFSSAVYNYIYRDVLPYKENWRRKLKDKILNWNWKFPKLRVSKKCPKLDFDTKGVNCSPCLYANFEPSIVGTFYDVSS